MRRSREPLDDGFPEHLIAHKAKAQELVDRAIREKGGPDADGLRRSATSFETQMLPIIWERHNDRALELVDAGTDPAEIPSILSNDLVIYVANSLYAHEQPD